MKSFSNQAAAIAGATSGMGRSLALQLAHRGCHLALADRSGTALVQMLQLVRAHEGDRIRVTTHVVDAADHVAVYRRAEEATAAHDRVNLIFDNVSTALSSTIEDIENDELAWIMNINFWDVMHGAKAFLPLLKATGSGHIINTSSTFGIFAQPGMGAYNASKYAVRDYTEALCQELDLMDCGVSAACVHPSGVKTNIARSSRVSPSMNDFLMRDEQQGEARFEKFFITSTDEAAQVVLDGVRKNKRHVLIDPGAHAANAMARVLSAAYRTLVAREARRTCKKALRGDTAPATARAKQEVPMDAAITGELFASPPRANLLNVTRAMLHPGRTGLRSVGRDVLITCYAKPQSRYLPLMGAHMHYANEGVANSRGTLLLIHGFGASLYTWDDMLSQLTRRYRVIRLDLPPFGITGPLRDAQDHPRMMELPLCRDLVDALVDMLGLSKLTLVGNSLDGMVSWDFAVRHPGRVEKLVLIDSAGLLMKLPIYIGLFNHVGVRMTSPWMLPEGITRAATRDVYGDSSRVSESTLRRYADFFYADGARQAIDKMVLKFHFDDVDTDGLTSIRVPTLILWGQRDRWIPPVHVGEFARRIPNTTLRMYPTLGHIPMEKGPARVRVGLCTFLDQGRASTRPSEVTFQENRP